MFSEHGNKITEKLRGSGLRPTRQRIALGKLLWPEDGRDQHLSAEELHRKVLAEGVHVSLATVYNTLHQFTDLGLLCQVVIDSQRTLFDTNLKHHHHFLYERSGRLEDIPADEVSFASLPPAPLGADGFEVDVVLRVDAA